MASQQSRDNIAHTAGQVTGQVQIKKDEYLNQASQASQEALDNANNPTYTSQASNFLQQKGEQVKNIAQGAGEQVKNMAHGAAEAVKSTLGMNTDNTPNPTNNPSSLNNPNNPSYPNNPSNPANRI